MAYLMQKIVVTAENAFQGQPIEISPFDFDIARHTIYEQNDESKISQIYMNLIQNFDLKKIEGTNIPGHHLDFSEAKIPATMIIEFSKLLVIADMEIFSYNQIMVMKNQCTSILHLFSRIQNFRFNGSDSGAKDRIIKELMDARNAFIDNMSIILSYSISLGLKSDLYNKKFANLFNNIEKKRDAIMANQNTAINNINNVVNQVVNQITEKIDENNQLGNNLRDLIGSTQVNRESNGFSDLADNYAKYANKWLICSIIVGALTLFISILFTFSYKFSWISPKNNIEAAQLVTSKFIILGIFGYALVASVKNYRSQMHNSVVNRHREHALKSFHAFVAAAPDTQIKGSILTQAAAAVFTPQDTGYVKNEEPAGSRSLIEMISKAISGRVA